jgi:prepilin-type N-terminal cleavage/methylation domain-containing protein
MRPASLFPRANSRSSGFTLVEILVTMTIIVILVSLLLPAISSIRSSARRKQAAVQATAVVNAIKQYHNVYGEFPGQTKDDADGEVTPARVIEALRVNPRKMLFLEIAEIDMSEDDEMLDPWGNPYVIVMDENGNGLTEVIASLDDADLETNVADNVAVFSWGAHPGDEEERIYSWRKWLD